MYTDIKSQLCLNGHIPKRFPITRSVRQGCPLSMQLFIIGTECFNEMIRKNPNIKGYKLPNGREKKLVLYAADITFIIENVTSIPHIFDNFNQYSRSSGATINTNKTEAIRLGKWPNVNIKEILRWEKDDLKILGHIFSLKDMQNKNFTPYLEFM